MTTSTERPLAPVGPGLPRAERPRRRRATPRALVTAAVLLAGGLLTPTAATAVSAEEVRWSAVPVAEDGEQSRISLRHSVDPGGRVSDGIAVSNHGAVDAVFTVAAGDGIVGDDGAFDISAGEQEGAGAWTSVGDGTAPGEQIEVPVAAGESVVVPVTVEVPTNATPGDHPGGVVVALAGSGEQVSVTHRVGVRLHLRVKGDVAPRLETADTSVTFTPAWVPFAPGTVRIVTTVGNVGNVRLAPALTLTATGPFGSVPLEAALRADEVLPGGTAVLSGEAEAWPLLLLFGDLELSGSAVGDDEVTPPAVHSESVLVPAVSWTGLLVLLLAAGAVVLLARQRRARRVGSAVTERSE
ncbi:hypothetical protein [Mycetocola reblochoni]|uniref:DUF916 domain-containing protein n=2 Tax=Mycetocola reblochoni TaxID=331618 RepID=A0A1R4JAJ7_9MICO|nr:hypothetical protein [Mycetocola reblochoni]RLP70026.1 hypothetical protein D9V30_04985 [Mycetocola reblochoni]SJN29150.1 hypothetical protein FM119_06425 [Mycetocola reblochoni REB411]